MCVHVDYVEAEPLKVRECALRNGPRARDRIHDLAEPKNLQDDISRDDTHHWAAHYFFQPRLEALPHRRHAQQQSGLGVRKLLLEARFLDEAFSWEKDSCEFLNP